ncbi:hypothetical protein PTKIN_Ptkin02bG0126600 [Pterospermum kingtungense]
MILINSWAIHRDPKLWDDLLIFKPESFEDGDTESYKFMPFKVFKEEIDMTKGDGLTMPKAQPLVAMCRARLIMNKVLAEAL